MFTYKVLKAITFQAGKFLLTATQLADRRYVVRSVKDEGGVYEPINEITFKIGETITTDIEINRALYSKLEPVDSASEQQVSNASVLAVSQNRSVDDSIESNDQVDARIEVSQIAPQSPDGGGEEDLLSGHESSQTEESSDRRKSGKGRGSK